MITEKSLRLLLENNDIADAKQKLLAKDLKKKNEEEKERLDNKLETLNGGLFVKNNFQANRMREALRKEHIKNTKIAKINKGDK